MTTRFISDSGLQFLKQQEGFRPDVYKDATGNDTVGFGHMLTDDEDFTWGITEEAAEDLLRKDLLRFEEAIVNYIKAQLNDNQFGALCSLCFNVGTKPLFGLIGTLLNLPTPDYQNAADGFLAYDKGHINGVLTVIEGLKNRRIAERQLFLTT